jgi:hypothetical protein
LLNGGILDGNFSLNEYVLGGAFSLDGLHPVQEAMTLQASRSINTTYGSILPMIDLGLYPVLPVSTENRTKIV